MDATTYDAKNRVTSRTMAASAPLYTRVLTYDDAYRTATITGTLGTTPNATTVQADTIGYKAGTPNLVQSITDWSTGGDNPGGGQNQCFNYDTRDRLQRAWTSGTAACNNAAPNPNYTAGAGNPDPLRPGMGLQPLREHHRAHRPHHRGAGHRQHLLLQPLRRRLVAPSCRQPGDHHRYVRLRRRRVQLQHTTGEYGFHLQHLLCRGRTFGGV